MSLRRSESKDRLALYVFHCTIPEVLPEVKRIGQIVVRMLPQLYRMLLQNTDYKVWKGGRCPQIPGRCNPENR